MNRRRCLQLLAGSLTAAAVPAWSSIQLPSYRRITGMGLVMYDCNLRRRHLRAQRPDFDLFEPLTFLTHCHERGAGGMQAALGVMTSDAIRTLRDFTESNDLFIDAIIRPPRDEQDLVRFESEIKTARDVGVQAARTVIMPGRRYERFQTLEECLEYQKRGQRMLELAVPFVEKHQVRLAVENHKDQTIEERVALYEHLSCEYIGACVDTGNSFALMDGAYESIEALAPYAFSVHLKDQALQRYDDGFLLGDIALGQGSFDMKRMVEILRQAKPDIKFSLELITRDPLKVPCFTEAFWNTMPTVAASQLAHTLQFVRENAVEELQQVSQLSREQQVQLEDKNVTESLQYAGQVLGL